jgi:hypothetical protein
MATVRNMRYCEKCHVLFYDAETGKGSCSSDGGTHQAQGFNFALAYGVPETANAQSHWQRCSRCQAIYFAGYKDKGRCNLGGQHTAGWPQAFVIPHDVNGSPQTQKAWEYCTKCKNMFYDGYEDKGHCTAGGGHKRHPDAYRFVMSYPPTAGQIIDE